MHRCKLMETNEILGLVFTTSMMESATPEGILCEQHNHCSQVNSTVRMIDSGKEPMH